ncbi:MAG: SLBB domain-containing protein [Armatimonadota bacterium]
MTSRSALFALFLSISLVTPLYCQQAAAVRDFIVDENYRISPGDVLVVSVLGEKDLSGPLAVGAGGSIALPIVGSVQVIGKSLSEARELIARTYRDVIREPYVSVALDETASRRRVYVGGSVEKPGSYFLPLGSTPAEAVVAAGLNDESDLQHVTVRRATGEVLVLDLTGLRTRQPLQTNIYLNWDDVIDVPNRDNRLTILGQVGKPGSYVVPLGRAVRVIDLLTQIGGGLVENANRQTALLLRAGAAAPQQIDLRKLLNEGDLSQNYELQGGDVLVVPEADRVTVAGEVNAPASFYSGTRLTLLEAMVRAGGFTPRAGLKQATIKRANGQICQVDLEALWRRGDSSQNIELSPGNVVVVPRADPEEVLITGAVARPGTVDVREEKNRSLLKILTSSGPIPAADLSRVSLHREGMPPVVANLRAAMERGDMRQNVQLQPGDIVFVPDTGKVALLGAFPRGGLLDYDPKLSLLQYVAAGGLPVPQLSVLSKGRLIRLREDGTYETIILDLSRLKDGIMPEPVKVQPGDIIFIEGREAKKSFWEQIRDGLFLFGSLEALLD